MKHSYFIFFSDCLDYPLYVAFTGYRTIDEIRDHDITWTVVRHLTQLDCKSFSIMRCTRKDFEGALIKIDFSVK